MILKLYLNQHLNTDIRGTGNGQKQVRACWVLNVTTHYSLITSYQRVIQTNICFPPKPRKKMFFLSASKHFGCQCKLCNKTFWKEVFVFFLI